MAKPPIFVGGAPRSGLTLLRVILESHSSIVSGPELNLIPTLVLQWKDFHDVLGAHHEENYYLPPGEVRDNFAALINKLFAKLIEASGKDRVLDKSAVNALVFDHIHSLFPMSPLVHVVRDGRDVVASLLRTGWLHPVTNQKLSYVSDAKGAATYWVQFVERVHQIGSQEGTRDRYVEIRYEDLVRKSKRTLRGLCHFFGEDYEADILDFYKFDHPLTGTEKTTQSRFSGPLDHASIGRWRQDLCEKDVECVKAIAGQTLIRLGYAEDLDW